MSIPIPEQKKTVTSLRVDNGFYFFGCFDQAIINPFAPQRTIMMPLTSTRIRRIRLLRAIILFMVISFVYFDTTV